MKSWPRTCQRWPDNLPVRRIQNLINTGTEPTYSVPVFFIPYGSVLICHISASTDSQSLKVSISKFAAHPCLVRREKDVAIPQSPAEYFGVRQTSDITGLSQQTIRKLISENELPAYRAGDNIRIRREDVEALMKPMNAVASKAKKSRKVSA